MQLFYEAGMLVLFTLSSKFGVVILMRLELYQSTHKVTDSLLSTQNRPNLMTLIWSLLEASNNTRQTWVLAPCVGGRVALTGVYFIEYFIISK